MGKMISLAMVSMRYRQWTKNLVLFTAIIFSKNLFNPKMLLISFMAFIIFCLLSGGVYIFNDLLDIEEDRKHPKKCKRPIAAGSLEIKTARIIFLITVLVALVSSFFINKLFLIIAISYFGLQVSYSRFLKRIVVIDVFCIAAGFFLRVFAGAEAIKVPVSSWLLVCTFFISLFIALTKRRHELIADSTLPNRQVLGEYNTLLLDQMISVVTASTVVAYAVYTLSEETVKKFNTTNLKYTIPFILYGIYRYLYLVYRKDEGGSPETVFLTDKAMITNIFFYFVVTVVIIYFARS